MKEKIGETAGRVWEVLREREEVTISQLPRILEENTAIVHQSLGWLAREGKIEYRKEGRSIFIYLNEKEIGL